MGGGRVLPFLTLTGGHTSNFPVGTIPTPPKALVQEFLQFTYRHGHSAPYWRVNNAQCRQKHSTRGKDQMAARPTRHNRYSKMNCFVLFTVATNLPFELRRTAGDCSRVTAGPIDLI